MSLNEFFGRSTALIKLRDNLAENLKAVGIEPEIADSLQRVNLIMIRQYLQDTGQVEKAPDISVVDKNERSGD